jgi:hypothetical protein
MQYMCSHCVSTSEKRQRESGTGTNPKVKKAKQSQENMMEKLRSEPPENYPGFKSNSQFPLCLFSNFFVGAEWEFMRLRVENKSPKLALLYKNLGKLEWNTEDGYKRFRSLRIRLQPSTNNNYSKAKYKDPYLKKGVNGQIWVASGLLAKLISGCFRPSQKTRLGVVNKLANEYLTDEEKKNHPTDIVMSDFYDGDKNEKRQWMEKALSLKFQNPVMRMLLCETNKGWLWERKGNRDKNSNFAGKEGLLKDCLWSLHVQLNEQTDPTKHPTTNPTEVPTANPTEVPTANPTEVPTANPTKDSTANPIENSR